MLNIKVKTVSEELNRLTLDNNSLQITKVFTRFTKHNEEETKFCTTGLPASGAFM
ncbi:hypothetical protein DPMN_182353 [Dreissena polymorpha]|uniref:Uncharacterized protein n=1 Tax=Dreissena polymorpha TaxID=45954 RepID=A0A9D4DFA7_DREPO|nr:hypothetical protein DPMN_182353 [Dreissena polymorpha]